MSTLPQSEFTSMFSLPPRSSPPLAADPFQSISSSQNVVFHPALSLPTFQTVLESADSSALPNQEEAAQRSQLTSSAIEIVTYNQQLTEADRLDMIARRWRNDLLSAVEQQETYKESHKDTEGQIAVAIKQLEEL